MGFVIPKHHMHYLSLIRHSNRNNSAGFMAGTATDLSSLPYLI
ncbi:hypothetical protein HPTD01_1916 [Halomonas sp. TD01]|nr:hypothetical protein HPTD01_1916 [Halomonas sp. TD01]